MNERLKAIEEMKDRILAPLKRLEAHVNDCINDITLDLMQMEKEEKDRIEAELQDMAEKEKSRIHFKEAV